MRGRRHRQRFENILFEKIAEALPGRLLDNQREEVIVRVAVEVFRAGLEAQRQFRELRDE